MRTILFAVSMVAMCASSAAFADDSSTRWTGIYAGVHAGGQWTNSNDVTVSPADAATRAFWGAAISTGVQPTALRFDKGSFEGGGQIGYNLQAGAFVVGLEADISGLSGNGHETVFNPAGALAANTTTAESQLNWLGTVRGRLGVLASPDLLAFVTGGLAYGGIKADFSGNFETTNDHFAGSVSSTEVGWIIGGGLEWAMTNYITLRGEYLYYDLGDVDFSTRGFGRAQNATSGNFNGHAGDFAGNIVRLAVNYKFD